MKYLMAVVSFLAASCVIASHPHAQGQLRWPESPKKEALHVRLVAIALSDPRSSFFTSHEVFVAERELGREEWSLIKLVYTFLPYQPRLSDAGMDYSTVHQFSAVRDTNCDETLAQMTSSDWPDRHQINLRYSQDSPLKDLERRRTPLPCYETTADDYTKSAHEPIPTPELNRR
jgi:hypothetical protein